MVTRNKKKSLKSCYRITKSNDNCRIDTYNQWGYEGSFAFQKHHGWWQQALVLFDGLEEVLFGLFMLKKRNGDEFWTLLYGHNNQFWCYLYWVFYNTN